MMKMVAKVFQGLALCSVLWTITEGEFIHCFTCMHAYDRDLSSIKSVYARMALNALISSYSITPECRTPGANNSSLIKSCPSSTRSKIPACVVFDGTLVFASKYSSGENFTLSIIYRGCVDVDSNYVTSCYQIEEADWTSLQMAPDLANFQEACTTGYFTGSVCYNVSAVDSEGVSLYRYNSYHVNVQLVVFIVLKINY